MHQRAVFPCLAEFDPAIRQCKQCEVTALPDIFSRVELRPALAHEDIPGTGDLTAEELHAEAFAVAVATVF